MDLGEDVLAELGRIAFEAAGLDVRVVQLAVLLGGNAESHDTLLQQPGQRVRNLVRTRAESISDTNLGNDVIAWLDTVEALLRDRNALVHAEWVNVVGSEGGHIPMALHTKSSSMIPADFIPRLELARRLREVGVEGGPLVHRAAVACGLFQPER